MSINSLKLGNLLFPVNMIQGPLAGVSAAPFRLLTWRYGRPAFSCTEMISCQTILHQPRSSRRYLLKDPQEGPVCFQLSADNPTELAVAVKTVTDCGADLIDLNAGCPVKKIRRRGEGSRLLSDPLKLYHLIRTMKENTQVPVSIKIRVDGDSDDQFNQHIAKVVTEAGADFLVVHGRHWRERYDVPCRYADIAFFVQALKIPVIGNGDIGCVKSLRAMLNTGCHGVMICRSGVGQPWLFSKLQAEMQQQAFSMPTMQEIAAMFLEHIYGLSALMQNEKIALLQARTLAKYYARPLKEKSNFISALNTCATLKQLEILCQQYFMV